MCISVHGRAPSTITPPRRSLHPAGYRLQLYRTGHRTAHTGHDPTTVTVAGSRDPPRPHAHTDQTQECRCALGCPRPRSTHRIFGAVPADRTHSITSPCALTHKLTHTKSRTDPDYVGFHISDVQLKMASRTLMPTPQDVVTRPTDGCTSTWPTSVAAYADVVWARGLAACGLLPAPRTCNHSHTK